MENKKVRAPRTVSEFADLLSSKNNSDKSTSYRMDNIDNEENRISINRQRRRLISKNSLYCPQCGKILNSQQDRSAMNAELKCFDCVIKEESLWKRMGIWEPIVRWRTLQSKIKILSDELIKCNEFLVGVSAGDIKYITNDSGSIERWNIPADGMAKEIVEYVEKVEVKLKDLVERFNECETFLNENIPDWKDLLNSLEEETGTK